MANKPTKTKDLKVVKKESKKKAAEVGKIIEGLPITNTKTPMPEVKEPKEEKKDPTPAEIRNMWVSSSIDDCMIVVKTFKKVAESRPLTVPEASQLFDAYFTLAEIFNTYGTDKNDALKYITSAIEAGNNILDAPTVSRAMLFRSRIKVATAQLIKG